MIPCTYVHTLCENKTDTTFDVTSFLTIVCIFYHCIGNRAWGSKQRLSREARAVVDHVSVFNTPPRLTITWESLSTGCVAKALQKPHMKWTYIHVCPMVDWNGKVILVLVNRETLTFTFALGRCFYPNWLTVSRSVERCCLIIIIVIHNSILGHLLIWSS